MDEKEIDKKYIDFIENLIGQIQPLLPKDVNKLQEDYLVSNIRRSAMLMASGIQDDEEFSRIDFEQQCFYIQIMAEWSFHKEIDLFRSGIPAKYHLCQTIVWKNVSHGTLRKKSKPKLPESEVIL